MTEANAIERTANTLCRSRRSTPDRNHTDRHNRPECSSTRRNRRHHNRRRRCTSGAVAAYIATDWRESGADHSRRTDYTYRSTPYRRLRYTCSRSSSRQSRSPLRQTIGGTSETPRQVVRTFGVSSDASRSVIQRDRERVVRNESASLSTGITAIINKSFAGGGFCHHCGLLAGGRPFEIARCGMMEAIFSAKRAEYGVRFVFKYKRVAHALESFLTGKQACRRGVLALPAQRHRSYRGRRTGVFFEISTKTRRRSS